MRWRWVAGILWAVVAAWGLSRTLSNEFSTTSDLVLVGVLLVAAFLIAMGRGPGLVVALFATLLAGLATLFVVATTIFGCSLLCPSPWSIPPAVALMLASALAFREINRTR